eukprot:gene3846-biopygen12137
MRLPGDSCVNPAGSRRRHVAGAGGAVSPGPLLLRDHLMQLDRRRRAVGDARAEGGQQLPHLTRRGGGRLRGRPPRFPAAPVPPQPHRGVRPRRARARVPALSGSILRQLRGDLPQGYGAWAAALRVRHLLDQPAAERPLYPGVCRVVGQRAGPPLRGEALGDGCHAAHPAEHHEAPRRRAAEVAAQGAVAAYRRGLREGEGGGARRALPARGGIVELQHKGKADGRRLLLCALADRAEAGDAMVGVVRIEAASLRLNRFCDKRDLVLEPLSHSPN